MEGFSSFNFKLKLMIATIKKALGAEKRIIKLLKECKEDLKDIKQMLIEQEENLTKF